MMDLYVMDMNHQRLAVQPKELLEGYISLTWTEKYAGIGSFKLVTPYNQYFRDLLKLGTFLHHTRSDRICRIESVSISDQGGKTLTLEGRSLEYIFAYRYVDYRYGKTTWSRSRNGLKTDRFAGGYTDPTMLVTRLIREFLSGATNYNSETGYDYEPYGLFNVNYVKLRESYIVGTPPDSRLAYRNTELEDIFRGEERLDYFHFKPGTSLLEALQEVCEATGSGFRLSYDIGNDPHKTGTLTNTRSFGADRTVKHERIGDPIVFSSSNGVLSNNEKVESNVDYTNGAYATTKSNMRASSIGMTTTFNPPTTNMLDAKYVYKHYEPEDDTEDLTYEDVRKLYRSELNRHNITTLLRTEVNIHNPQTPKLKQDYLLGDIVLVEDVEGVRHRARTVEHTFIYSARDGYNEIPTFDYIDL